MAAKRPNLDIHPDHLLMAILWLKSRKDCSSQFTADWLEEWVPYLQERREKQAKKERPA